MGKVSQKEAVFKAVTVVLGSLYDAYQPMRPLFGDRKNCRDKLKNDRTDRVATLLIGRFERGEVTFANPKSQPNDIEPYCRNLMFNWLRKDKRLNGGRRKPIPRPDQVLKAMVLLYRGFEGTPTAMLVARDIRRHLIREAIEPYGAEKMPESLLRFLEIYYRPKRSVNRKKAA